MLEGNLQLVWEDVAELVRINPLAAEQLKNIALRRNMAALERRLAGVAEGSSADGGAPVRREEPEDGP